LLSSHAQQAGISTSGKPCNFNVIEGLRSNWDIRKSIFTTEARRRGEQPKSECKPGLNRLAL
jgi:hypothetical protein